MARFDANIDPGIMGRFRWKTDSFELKQTLTKEALKEIIANTAQLLAHQKLYEPSLQLAK